MGGVDAQEFPGGIPEADHVLAFCQASFHMTLSRVGSSCWLPAEVGCHFLLQGPFSTQGLNPHLLHCRLSVASQAESLPTATREALYRLDGYSLTLQISLTLKTACHPVGTFFPLKVYVCYNLISLMLKCTFELEGEKAV